MLVPDVLVYTAAPERLGHYLRQQVRWSRSFIRESLWAVLHLPLRRPPVWLALAELTSWLLLTATLLVATVVAPALGAKVTLTTCAAYVGFTAAIAWLRSVRWFDATTPGEGRRAQLTTFAIAPLYAVLHVFLLLPLRFVALVTLRTTSWGTRKVVEVRLDSGRRAEPSLPAAGSGGRGPGGIVRRPPLTTVRGSHTGRNFTLSATFAAWADGGCSSPRC